MNEKYLLGVFGGIIAYIILLNLIDPFLCMLSASVGVVIYMNLLLYRVSNNQKLKKANSKVTKR